MKKTILSSLLLLFMCGTLFAQEGVHFGLKVNPIFSFVTLLDSNNKKFDSDVVSTKMRAGWEFGLAITYGFTETVGLGFGVEVNSRGWGTRYQAVNPLTGATQDAKGRQSFTTLEVPLYLKLRSPEIGTGIYVVGNVGTTIDVNISNRSVTEGFVATAVDSLGIPTAVEFKETTDSDPKRMNWVTVTPFVGVGVDWEFDWGTIEMMGSYHHGLMNVLNKNHSQSINSTAKISYVAIDLAYFF